LAEFPEGENASIADLSQRLATLLRRVSQTLLPDNLSRIGKPQIQEFLLVLEQMKMLMSELEIVRLLQSEKAGNPDPTGKSPR
jgi:hypothetical protein